MGLATENAVFIREVQAERAYRRGFHHALSLAHARVVAGATPAELSRWLDAVAEWRNVPFTELLPKSPPPG